MLVAAGAFEGAREVVRGAPAVSVESVPVPEDPAKAAGGRDGPTAREVRASQREVYALAFADAIAAAALGKADDARAAERRAGAAAEASGDAALRSRAHVLHLALANPGDLPDGDPLIPALRGDDTERRAARRATMTSRGGAPLALAAYVMFLGRLAPTTATEADVETWLDAALAIDARRFSMREVAFARMLAARARGQEGAAKAWADKLARLRVPFADARRATIARFLGM